MASSNLRQLFATVSLSLLVLQAAALPKCPDHSKADYDYVIVGAGVGGGPVAARLAQSGFSVLLVDAGHNVDTVNSTLPFYFARAAEDPQLELNYTYAEYSPGSKFVRNNEWYPRTRGLGGSTSANALIHNIAATEQDFNKLASMFNDSTWSYENMRTYFTRIEDNLFLNESDPNHGFNGWLKSNNNPGSIFENFPDAQFNDLDETLEGTGGPLLDDLNSAANVAAVGIGRPVFTMDEFRNRSTVRQHLLSVQQQHKTKIHFSLDTLATKVAMCDSGKGSPVAYGVEIAPGAALDVAGNFKGKQLLKTKLITVRHEVIISAGVFQTPRLLMLSGIGDKAQLSQHGIKPIVHLPGVGTNLQDHDEVSHIWELKQNHTIFNNCTVLYTTETDPCLEQWIEDDHRNLYGLGGPLWFQMTKSSPSIPEPDVLIYWLPGWFSGFHHGFSDALAAAHNVITGVALRGHASSRGVVQLTGSHPQDPLHIEKRHFEAPGGKEDIAALLEGFKVAQSHMEHPNISSQVEAQIFPTQALNTDEDIENHILETVFGHHACCTASMRPDDDPNAVLDGDFKVRGVKGLRVVDISSWAVVPGWFVATPTYMLSEKAADIIIAAAGAA